MENDILFSTYMIRKGTKLVHGRTSGIRRTVTVIACVSAAGQTMPPQFIFPGKTSAAMTSYNISQAPSDWLYSVSPSGWINEVQYSDLPPVNLYYYIALGRMVK